MKKLNMKEWFGVVVALTVVFMVFGRGWFGFSGGDVVNSLSPEKEEGSVKGSTSTTIEQEEMINISKIQGLEIYENQVGTGVEAISGKAVTVHYVGTMLDGSKFDSSLDRGKPFTFNLGAGQVIRGWDEGVVGMKVGGIRKLVISPELGYGKVQAGPIPPDSTLVFEVQLLEVK
jgi:FKBP-type peptidyl-prolyl cis-trans isomerase